MKPTIIYTLQLTDAKWYVGSTNDLTRRLQEHSAGEGAAWTQRYTPVICAEISIQEDMTDEMTTTLKLMNKHGIENVRGGPWCQMKLTPESISMINQQIESIFMRCYKCKKPGHIAANCTPIPVIPTVLLGHVCTRCYKMGSHTTAECSKNQYNRAKRELTYCPVCKRPNHTHDPRCSEAPSLVNGTTMTQRERDVLDKRPHAANMIILGNNADETIKSSSVEGYPHRAGVNNHAPTCERCRRVGHETTDCYATTTITGATIDKCTRCYRENHLVADCHAKTYADGKEISVLDVSEVLRFFKLR